MLHYYNSHIITDIAIMQFIAIITISNNFALYKKKNNNH